VVEHLLKMRVASECMIEPNTELLWQLDLGGSWFRQIVPGTYIGIINCIFPDSTYFFMDLTYLTGIIIVF
jgi:hypothetical protein